MPRPTDAQLIFDPAVILRAQGLEPDPWQEELLADPGRQVLLNCSRQCGKSRTVSALAVHAAVIQPDALVLLLSPSLRQSCELFRKVREGYHAIGRPVPQRAVSQTRLELANGARIVSLPGKEETIRSFSNVALLAIDEAARVPDDLYAAVRPMLAVSRGRLVCLSTPFGQRGYFHREWADPDAAWQRVCVPWPQCPRITADFIAGERRALGDSWVRQEYGCSFEALAGLVYPDFAAQCGVASAPERAPELGGIDFGYRNPFAAVWGHVDHDGVLWITGERYAREQTIHEHARRLPPGLTWYADPSGADQSAALRQFGHAVRPGPNDLRAGIAAVRARLETGKLKVLRSACPNLLAEAQLYRYPSRQDGGDREKPVDEHSHALAALRYLVARLDRAFIRQYLRKPETRNLKPET
jgi:hypothetical protein